MELVLDMSIYYLYVFNVYCALFEAHKPRIQFTYVVTYYLFILISLLSLRKANTNENYR